MNQAPVPATHPAFELKRSQRIATLNLTAYEFVHRRTGAMHYHLESPHEENVFMVAVRTVPMNSTGVAHILEHTALCGSERFPVRDPFFWMIRRSLNTFMNAFTTSDYTAYPFASQNRKDFGNLLDVYLDAVFFSRLDPLDFAQEGHRLEFAEPHDPASGLVYRGVVYNEMKGETSSPISVLYEALKAQLFPETTYHYNSGGDPAHIPELTYDDLLAFYKSHYQPGNAVFMTFGNIPVLELQQAFEDKALARFNGPGPRIEVGYERRYKAPVRASAPYAIEAGEDVSGKTHIVIGWLLGVNTDLMTLLKCNLLSDVLLDTSASPLRFALETTPLAGGVSPLSGLEETSHEMNFICGVEGSDAEHADAIEQLVMNTLARVARDGVPEDRLEACLHQLELSQREIGGDGAPFGLQLIFSCMSAAIHRGDPIALLDLDPVLASLRREIADPGFIKRLVQELLLDNPHRVTLVMYPDPAMARRVQQAEDERLRQTSAQLSESEVQALIDRADALEQRQNAVEDIDVLPRVGLSDIPQAFPVPQGQRRKLAGGLTLTCYEAGTNGLVYHQVITSLPSLEPDLMALLPIYSNIVPELGSGGLDYLETQHLQHSRTGGISCYSTLRGLIDDPDTMSGYLTLSSRTLNPRTQDMVRLVRQTLVDVHFSESQRICELVKQMRVRREASITGNGHGLAMSAAASRFRPVSLIHHQLSGLAGIRRLKELDDSLVAADGVDRLLERLGRLKQRIDMSHRQLLVISDPGFLDAAVGMVSASWPDTNGGSDGETLEHGFEPAPWDQAWVTSTQVNFCASAFKTVSEAHPDSAPLSVLAGVLRNGFLHKVLREQGGAYGGGASHDASNGVFRFHSYRDPNLMRTFDAFQQAVDWILESDIGFDLVEESILGLVAGIDAPGSPAGTARQAFHHGLFGRSAEHRRRIRSRLLEVTVDDIKRVAASYLKGEHTRALVTNDAGAKALPGSFVTREI